MYQVVLEVCFRVFIKLMFDMYVYMINCNNVYIGSFIIGNLYVDKYINNIDFEGQGCKSFCINKIGLQ